AIGRRVGVVRAQEIFRNLRSEPLHREQGRVKRDRQRIGPAGPWDVSVSVLDSVDLTRSDQPASTGDPKDDLVAWLRYQRHEFLRKLRDLDPSQMAACPWPPVDASVRA